MQGKTFEGQRLNMVLNIYAAENMHYQYNMKVFCGKDMRGCKISKLLVYMCITI